jgi:small-conductance mechanosensitive channel
MNRLIIFTALLFISIQKSLSQGTALLDSLQGGQANGNADNTITTAPELINYFSTSKIFYSLFLILLTYIANKIIVRILVIWAERKATYRITIKGLIPMVRMILWISVIVFIITVIFQPPMATVIAFTASIGVAIGFAAQDLLKNIFGGLTILFDRPFQVGDKVQIGDHYGEVVEVGLRATRIQTMDDNLVSVPNGMIMSQSVANANASEQNLQVNTFMYLPINYDINKAKRIALEAAKVSRFVYLNKPVDVLFIQEVVGQKLFLKMTVKAYVNDIRNENKFKSELTEVLSNFLIDKDRD